MGLIPPNVHRILDYLAVIVFALAPTLFHLNGNTRLLAYGLAVVHLVVTLATHFPGAAVRPLPYHVHGIIELIVGLALVCIPFVRHWTFGARQFFPAIGAVIVVMWLLTRYRDVVVPIVPTPAA